MNRFNSVITLFSFICIGAMQSSFAQQADSNTKSRLRYKNDQKMIARVTDSTGTMIIARATSDDPMPNAFSGHPDFEFTVLNGNNAQPTQAYVLKTPTSEINLDKAAYKLLKFNWIEAIETNAAKDVIKKYSDNPGVSSVVFIRLKNDSLSEALITLKEAGKLEASLNE